MEYVTGIERRAFQRGFQLGFRLGFQLGLEQGQQKAVAAIMLGLLRRQFGELKYSIIARIEALPLKKLEQLCEALPDLTYTKDLNRWLREHGPARRKTKAR